MSRALPAAAGLFLALAGSAVALTAALERAPDAAGDGAAQAAANRPDTESGLPVPRFVSLSADRVNARAGPGRRFPVNWVFLRRALPVEVVDEFDQWRRVRDSEGAEGWVHQAMLSGRRTVLVVAEDGAEQPLRQAPDTAARPVALAGAGVQGALLECRAAWCEVSLDGHRGWMPRAALWGVYPDESVSD